ncbi:MAG: UPF0182 family protein [Thermomicrobiales bacterium]
MLITAVIIVLLLLLLFGTASFWIQWWWFESLGYRSVLTRNYSVKIVSFLAFGAIAALFFFGNVALALRRTRPEQAEQGFRRVAGRAIFMLAIAGAVLIFLISGIWGASKWQTWLLWLHGRSFGIEDPVFHRDAGFYVFTLPALSALRSGLLAIIVVTIVAVIFTYGMRLGVRPSTIRQAPSSMLVHVFALGGALLLVLGFGYVIANYELVYSGRGVVYGVSYTDAHIQRYVNLILAAMSIAAAILLFANAFVRRVRWLVLIVGVWVVVSLFLGVFLPSIVQRSVVEPSELKRENPYIANNLEMTTAAYGLQNVSGGELSGQEPVTPQTLSTNSDTIENVRLWDYRVIRQTFQQLQSFAPYYVFNDVDVERYVVNNQLRQVLLSAREMETSGLPETAKTWTNQRLVYTRGYAVVVSPSNEISPQGLPQLWVANVPPTGDEPLNITRPEIYFGELSSNWVIVDSNQSEFNGLSQGNQATNFQGTAKGSIRLNNFLKRLMTAAYLKDRNVFLSGAINDQSQLLMRRDITGRIHEIAPFLTLDPDPYLVIANGKLYWIVDAYTTTDRFPDSTPTSGFNYIRNSVKVVVDAYDGTTTFYRTANPDPIADAFGKIYPDLFEPISNAPPVIAGQFRYPEHLFDVQSEVYTNYHITDPTSFYNGEDRWAIPQEQTGNGTVAEMEAYYVVMKLPSESELGLSLIRPFTPGGSTNRQNMTAWMAGQVSSDGSLQLVVYRFPRQETVFGPQQIEARILQEPDISAQITLWNQAGSRVVSGNLLVIPLGESVLYVEPLYLQATGPQGGLPELKRVIVASNQKVVMRPTLKEALQALVEGAPTTEQPAEPPTEQPPPTTPSQNQDVASLSQQALEAYQRGQQALQQGDWTTYGQQQAILADLLQRLATATGTAPATPVATPTP